MNIVDRFVFLYTLIVIIFTNCVGSIYYNKKSRVAATEPMVYLLPSSYVGRFYYFEEKKSDGEKSTVMSSVAFDEWETFNVSVHRVFRKVLGKRGIDVEVLPTVHPGWGRWSAVTRRKNLLRSISH